jgi:Zinc knuckle
MAEEAPFRMTLLLGGAIDTDENPVTRDEFLRYCREDAERLFELVARRMLQMDDEIRKAKAALEDANEAFADEIEARDATIAEKEIVIEGLEAQQGILMNRIAQMALDSDASGAASPLRVPAPVARKSTKLPDPPELEDGIDPKFDDWALLMKDKLEANADHYDTPKMRMAYVVGRTKGEARQHLMPRMKKGSPDRYQDAADLFEHLETVYNDPNRTLVAREKLRKLFLRQSDKFHTFLSEFLRLAAETKIPKDEWKEELHRRLTVELQKMTAAKLDEESTPFKDFADHCSRMASRLAIINSRAQRVPRTTGSSFPGTKTSSTSPVIKAEGRGNQITNMDTYGTYERLMRQGKCFGCQEFGHIRRDCPKTRTSLQLKAMEGNGDDRNEFAKVTENEKA